MKVLVVEDEPRIADAIKSGLSEEAYAVDVEYDGEDGLLAAKAIDYDLILLDVMMPSMDGYTVCAKLRAEGSKTPIIMLTAKDQEQDIIKGLDAGADDYIAKPFSFDVLLARMRAILRRPPQSLGEVLKIGELSLNPSSKRVERAGTSIELSTKEYAILEFLMRHPGEVVSKDQIIEHVWSFEADVLPNNVEVFMTYLRTKLDKPFKHKMIRTVRGFGYTLEEYHA